MAPVDNIENISDVNDAIKALGSTFHEFKKTNDARHAEIEKKGTASALLEEKVDKMSEAVGQLTEVKERLEKAETTLNRTAKGIPGEVDGKSADPVLAEYREGLGRYLRSGDEKELPGLERKGVEAKALTSGSDPEGGYLITPEYSDDIIKTVTELTPMRSLARVRQIGTRSFRVRKRTSGASTGGWGRVTPTKTGTPKRGYIEITAHRLWAMPAIEDDLIEDAEVNVEQWIAEEVALEFAVEEGKKFILGDGVEQPRGILTFAAGTGEDKIQQVASGDATLITADGLVDLQNALKETYQTNAHWLMNRSTVTAIRKLKSTTNQYLWQPGLTAGETDILLGRPIVKGADMPVVAANALSIAYGDFRRAYTIVDRRGIRVKRDDLTEKPDILAYTSKRTGGDVTLHEAIKLQKISA